MKYKEYLDMRNKLMDELQNLIDSGASDEDYNAKKAEIEALDQKWDDICNRQADLNALSDNQRTVNVQAAAGVSVQDAEATATLNLAPQGLNQAQLNDAKSDLYMTAFAKTLKGENLTAAEAHCFDMVNTYTHTTQNTGIVVPETFAQGIWDIVETQYPLWADVSKTYVKGDASIIKSTSSTEAAWYDETMRRPLLPTVRKALACSS